MRIIMTIIYNDTHGQTATRAIDIFVRHNMASTHINKAYTWRDGESLLSLLTAGIWILASGPINGIKKHNTVLLLHGQLYSN